jgi:hypothetical protein
MGRGKVKLNPLHATEAQKGNRCRPIAQHIRTLGAKWERVGNVTPQPIYSREGELVLINGNKYCSNINVGYLIVKNLIRSISQTDVVRKWA